MLTLLLLVLLPANSVYGSTSELFALPGQVKLRAALASNQSKHESPTGRIINGAKVPEGKYTFMASLQFNVQKGKWAHFCGGIFF